MKIEAKTPEEYIAKLPEDRQKVMQEIRNVINQKIPKGFKEEINYGMIGYVVPHSIYPNGYHCNPALPLPFINIASQKNFIALYHMGIYADKNTLDWFVNEYAKHSKTKLDMGKSCIRFKKIGAIPYQLIGELVARMDTKTWIKAYESALKK